MAAAAPQTGPLGARDARRALVEGLLRAFAILAGLFVGTGILLARVASGRPLGIGTFAALYLALTVLIWGLNGFFFRRLPLTGGVLFLFSAAAFGVLFLLGYFLAGVAGPFLVDAANRLIGFLSLVDLVFYAFAAMTVGGAAGCAFSRNIVYSGWSLLFAFLGVAGLYIFLGADFPAVAQVLVYIGGILVLILFAIMLTNQIGGDPRLTNTHLSLPAGAALAVAATGMLAYTAIMTPWKIVANPSYASTVQGLGAAFLTDYLLPFEVASVVLLAALVGAVVIARKEIKVES